MNTVRNLHSKRIEAIEITLVHNEAGEFGAFTTQEPLFFLTDANEERLRSRVSAALTDYVRRFHGDDNVTVEIVDTVVAPEPIRVKKLSRLGVQLEYA